MDLVSGYPFWLMKDGLPFEYPSLQDDIKTAVVIIGGGISGALAGYHLNNAGIDCVIVDGRSIGLGSTCASTSLLQYEIDIPLSVLKEKIGIENAVRSYKLCEMAIDKLGAIANKIKFNNFQFKESLYYAAYKKDENFLQEEYTIRKKAGFKVNYLTAENVKKDYDFEAAAILSETGAQTDSYGFTHAIHQFTIKRGLRIYDRTQIVNINYQKRSVQLKTANGNIISAKKIVFANGYEAVNYIDKKIVDLNSTYAVISEAFNADILFWKDEALIWNTADPYLYLRTTANKRIIIGGRDEPFSNAIKRDRFLHKKTAQLVNDFNKLFPSLKFKPEFSWTGTFGSTKDGLPYIGSYKKNNNSFFALGFGGNGITFSLIAAEIITDIILKNKNADSKIFSFDRV